MSSILTLDEINLLLHSEEPKNAKLYGNLYESLLLVNNNKALSLEQLPKLNDIGKAALTYNKKTLLDTVIKEWFAESVSEEDPSKKVKCGLCNTPNKYLYYIRNRRNGDLLNVGSSCINKFPGIDGYIEQKQQLKQIYKGQCIIARRTEFYNKFPNVEQVISDAELYFSNLPILLPYDLYTKLKDTVFRMRIIYTKYVNEGKKPFKSAEDSFELFRLAKEQYKNLEKESDHHITNYKNNPLVCEREEIDWMIHKNELLLEKIAKNNGIYSISTLQYMCSRDFVVKNSDIIFQKNKSSVFKPLRYEDNGMLFSFNKTGYQPPVVFFIKYNDFMKEIGARCLVDPHYNFGSKDLHKIANAISSEQNLQSIIYYLYNIVNKLGCALLIDDVTNSLYLYRKSDKAIRYFVPEKFVLAYGKQILRTDKGIEAYIGSTILGNKETKWLSKEDQSKKGIDDKIRKLYNEQNVANWT